MSEEQKAADGAEDTHALYSCRAILGANGSGKTSLEQQYIDAARAVGRPVFIVDPQNQFPGDPDAYWNELELEAELWKLHASQWSGLIVLDDADLFLDSTAHKGSVWRNLLISFRHWQCDVILVSRRPQEIPKLAMDVCGEVALFMARSPRAREVYAKWFGPEVLEHIPTEPFRYWLLNTDSLEGELFQTQRRETTTRADEK